MNTYRAGRGALYFSNNPDMNKVILIGHLGGDPDLNYTLGGQVVATFSVATKEAWKDKNGNRQECVERHRCVAWNKLAEVATEYLKKGSMVYVEGKLQTRDWTDKEGIKRYITEIVVRDIQVLNHKSNGVAPDVPPLSDEITLLPKRNGRRDSPFKFMLKSIFTLLNHSIACYNKIPIPSQLDAAVLYQHLLRLEAVGEREHIVEGVEKPVSVQKLLNGVELPNERRKSLDEFREGFKMELNINNSNTVSQSNVNQTTATSHSEATSEFNFTMHLNSLQSGLNELREEAEEIEPEAAKEIAAIQQKLEKLEQSQKPEEVKKAGVMNKLKRFFDEANDTSTTLGKTVGKIKSGCKILQDLAGKYNKIAEWCGLPQVPSVFVKNSDQ